MSLTFSASPRALSRALKNVVAMVTELRGEPATKIPWVEIVVALPTGPTGGRLHATGRGLYTAGMDSAEIWGDVPGRATIRVLAANPEKTDEVDDLLKLAMAIQRTSSARDARVHLTIEDGVSLAAYYGEEFLGELGEVDPGRETRGTQFQLGWFEEVVDAYNTIVAAPPTTKRLAFDLALLARLKDVKTESGVQVADFKVHPHSNTVGIAMGETFRGLYEGIDRIGYAMGGSWGDGPGSPESLLN